MITSWALALQHTTRPTLTSTTCAPTRPPDLPPPLPLMALSYTQTEAQSFLPLPPPHPPPQRCLFNPGQQGLEILPSIRVRKAVTPRKRTGAVRATPPAPAARMLVRRWVWNGWIWASLWHHWWVWYCLALRGRDHLELLFNVDRWRDFLCPFDPCLDDWNVER